MMPADLRERVWEVFAHGGDFQPIAGCSPAGCSPAGCNPITGCNENSWEIIGLQEIPVGLSAILESPQYAQHVLHVAASEKRLNSEAEALHGQLYGNDYYPPAMRHQLLARYHQIEAHRRIRGLCPLSRAGCEPLAGCQPRAGRKPTEDFR
ncbi:MAG: hypothetical protein ACYCY2_00460 [Acidithiobacillus ferriphilus]